MAYDIPGWFTEPDVAALNSIAERLPDSGVLVELGSLFGRSASFWAEAFDRLGKDYTIYCVDNFAHQWFELNYVHESIDPMHGDLSMIKEFSELQLDHHEMALKILLQYDNIIPVKHDLVTQLPFVDEVQCIFEDASHQPHKYRIAVNNWYPRLSPGGIFCGHDYRRPMFDGLCDEIDLFAEQNGLVVKTHPNSSVYEYGV